MSLSIKNVKFFIGMEGHGFNLSLYLDGKKVALVIDEAQGGEWRYHWEGKTAEERKANQSKVDALVAQTPPRAPKYEFEKGQHPNDQVPVTLDDLVSDLLDAWELEKQLKKERKTYVCFRTPDTGVNEFRRVAHKGNPAAAEAWVKHTYPDAVIL